MKHYTFIYVMLVALALSSCSSGKKLAQQQQAANQYFYEKNYDSAAVMYETIINQYEAKNISASPETYASAGKSFYYSGDEKKAIDYLYRAECMGYDDELTLILKIKYYGKIDNMSKELDNLEKYQSMYRNGDEIQYVRTRLVKRYVQMKEYQKVQRTYEQLSDPEASEIEYLEYYYTALSKNGNNDKAYQTAQKIFNLDPNNFTGLSNVARHTFDHAETAYVAAIKEYEAKKTNAAYRTMVEKTKPLLEEYKKAKIYYQKLYNLYKRPIDAEILSRIYTRLNDKKNAAVYAKLANQNNN